MCLRKCKLCKSNVKTSVFEGFANWMQDDGNQQKYFKNYIIVLAKLMTHPCRIDARKSNAKKNEKITPTWRQNGGRNPSKNIKKNTKTHHEKWCKNEAPKSYAPGGAVGPGVPEEVRSSSGDSRSRFPLASNILQKTNTRQTTKKQSPRTSGGQLARTWRAGRHGADLYIYWARAPPES